MNTCINGDVQDVLPTLPAGSVQMCVTSPPYWGLRDYGVDGQLGLEKTPDEYVEKMVAVFREVRRVLKDDGTCWVNLGDSYAGNGSAAVSNSKHRDEKIYGNVGPGFRTGLAYQGQSSQKTTVSGLKPKDLTGIPWRVAFALQADGWYLRQDIIWHKPNPMPESVTDRCTKAHEYLFLLSKSERYWFDAEAIAEKADYGFCEGGFRGGAAYKNQMAGQSNSKSRGETNSIKAGKGGKRNRRSVWTVNSQPFSEAHFATFPEKLIEPCILAGSRPEDVVLDPFFGSGTTGQVCERLGRQWMGIELNPEYIEIAKRRTAQIGLGF